MKRLGLVLVLSGCQLVIGDIDLPGADAAPEPTVDAGLDAVLDATVDARVLDAQATDAQVDAAWDAQGVDAALDAAVDAAVDAALPDAAPPWEPSALAGTWHAYAITGNRRQITLRIAALQIDPDGTAIITDLGSDAPLADSATPLGPHPVRTSLVTTNLFPVVGLLIGTLDPVAGLGVLVNDAEGGNSQATFVVLAREKPEPPWPDEVLYAHLRVQPVGEGEVGQLLARGAQHIATQRVQVGESPVALPDRAFQLAREPHGRVAFTPAEDSERVLFSPGAEGTGGPGVYEVAGLPVGLTLALRGGGVVDRAQRFFCGGGYFDATAAFATPGIIGVTRPTETDPELTFPDGRRLMLVPTGDGFLRTETRRGFFQQAGGIGALDATGRALLLLDGDLGTGTGRWGAALCIALGV